MFVASWHLHIDHGHIRAVRERPAQEILGVTDLGDDIAAWERADSASTVCADGTTVWLELAAGAHR